jgi:beta-lactamase regulating signal transducer with metallopeptidase domain
MNTFLIYILESTICISVFYLLFRVLMRKETSFAVNRATLLTIVAASVIVPLVQLPQLLQTPVHVELIPEFSESKVQIQNLPATENAASFEVQPPVSESAPATNELTIPLETLLRYFYLAGVLVTLLLFIRNIILIFLLTRKATVRQMDGYRLLIVYREVPSFAFGRSVIISQTDYDAHGPAILAHEQAHIRQNHFVDLLLLELVRILHWFNPAVYALIGDMKEIHEFQADEQTLHSGIDAKQYQLLIIQKGVGPRRFALANSFNHCQIKKRITMMNKQKTSKAWRWKVATFLPLLALLLMAFGNRSEKVPLEQDLAGSGIFTYQSDSLKQWAEADFMPISKKEIEKQFFEGKKIVNVLMNSKSELMIDGVRCQMNDVPGLIRKFRDSSFAQYKSEFSKVTINGKEKLTAEIPIIVRKDVGAKVDEYQKLLNIIGNTILEIRGRYAIDIFEIAYSSLTETQKDEVDRLIPFAIHFPSPKIFQEPQSSQSNLLIEIRKEGNYINNKLCTLEEIGKKAELLYQKNPNVVASLKVESDVPMSRVTEVKEVLRNSKVLNINYSTNTSNEIVYSVSDVTEKAKFSNGEWSQWIGNQLKHFSEGKPNGWGFTIKYSFVVDKTGKVRDGKIIKGCDYPEINSEFERILTQTPDWTPAKKNGVVVNVIITEALVQKINVVEKK